MSEMIITRGTIAQRTALTLKIGQLVYDTELYQMFVGDGSTPGGIVLATGDAASALIIQEDGTTETGVTDTLNFLAGIDVTSGTTKDISLALVTANIPATIGTDIAYADGSGTLAGSILAGSSQNNDLSWVPSNTFSYTNITAIAGLPMAANFSAATILAGNVLTTDASGVLSWAAGGSDLTIQEEGIALTTDATTLNFVGSSVTAAGNAATKTITITDNTVNGVTVSTTAPTANQILVATSGTTASWATPNITGIQADETASPPAVGEVLTAAAGNTATWTTLPAATAIRDVVVNATAATANQILVATSGTAASWATPNITGIQADETASPPAVGEVLTAAAGNTATWAAPAGGTISGVTVTGTASAANNIIIATSATAAAWSPTPAISAFSGQVTTSQLNLSSRTGNIDLGSGTITAGDFTADSDRRLKTSIEPLQAHTAMKALKSVNPVTYTMKSTSEPSIGFIAQDVEEHFPDLVGEDEDTGMKSMNYAKMTAVLWKQNQELLKRIEALEGGV